MYGLMQKWPLLCHKILDHAATQHGHREVVSRNHLGAVERTDYRAIRRNALRIAQTLSHQSYGEGDRIATMAWNSATHLECWYGIMGVGGVYHTLNPRLFPDQIAWIMNHAEDRALFIDPGFLPLMEKVAPHVATLEEIIVLAPRDQIPATSLNVTAYEDWIAEADGDFPWIAVDEGNAAGMCHTSGTTGAPKGAVYSHRSNVLHGMMAAMPDAMGLSSRDTVMPVVPMFHANAWGIAHAAPMVGAKLVMPGGKLDGASLLELLESERVTITAAVPTVWLMLLQHLEATGRTLPHLKKLIIGGAACPRSMIEKFEEVYGVEVIHAWGMTEMSPLGTLCKVKPETAGLQGAAKLDLQEKQGFAPFGVEMKVTDDANNALPWDGKTFGRLKVRGVAVSSAYYGLRDHESFDPEGWFDTGDVAHIDENGYMQITDRAKDVVKSGGEWISIITLENIAVGHPDVAEAAAFGVPHAKWDERPLLLITPKPGRSLDKAEILAWLEGKVAKWWMPDDVLFGEIPHTSTGKILKTALRGEYRDHLAGRE